jgi:hypothetical protein
MLPTHRPVATAQGATIFQRQPGFEYTPMLLGRIASFLVHGEEDRWVAVAVMVPFLDGGTPVTREDAVLLTQALGRIEALLDLDTLWERPDWTFVYQDGDFVEVVDPSWWIPVGA